MGRTNHADGVTPGKRATSAAGSPIRPIDAWQNKRRARDTLSRRTSLIVMINDRAGGNAPLIAQEIVAWLHSEKPQRPS